MHRVWVTDPNDPREIKNVLKNETLQQEVLNSMEVLKRSGGDWKFYFWTNDKSLIPETVQWMEKNGYTVREFKELPSYDKVLQKVLSEYVDGNVRSGSASDFAR